MVLICFWQRHTNANINQRERYTKKKKHEKNVNTYNNVVDAWCCLCTVMVKLKAVDERWREEKVSIKYFAFGEWNEK